MHTSVAIKDTIEFLDIVKVNPLISKCKIKVCYVGAEPNRNRTVITEDVAREIAQSLPGSPIVGYFNDTKKDFEEHNPIFQIKDGQIVETTNTRPYGFVDLNAKVWFEEYLDDGMTQRKYLVTEGYIWTGQYPETKKIFSSESGNPQSLEFDTLNNTFDGFWTKDYNGNCQFFIINEAVISKLCILGEDIEPCFEGSSVSHYSLNEEFKTTMFNLITEMKNILKEGGATMSEEMIQEQEVQTEEVVETPVVEEVPATEETVVEGEPATDFKKDEKKEEEGKPEEETSENKEETPKDEESTEDEDDENKKKKYNLEEVTEYVELKSEYEALQASYSALEEEVTSLRQFKLDADKTAKEELIKSFYMLSDEDKEDVITNIDKYSFMDIKSKLSIMCVDKKVTFTQEETNQPQNTTTYNLAGEGVNTTKTIKPAWLQQVEKHNNK